MISEHSAVEWGPSTVRAELAALEEGGYLTHPHTSAGRVPTDAGYRSYVDFLLESGPLPARGPGVELELSELRREVDEAMRETTTALAQVTDLMALVTAPAIDSATIHRVEVLLLQPNLVMVVVITSTGSVTKRAFSFEGAVDPGLVEWAASYLNESLAGMGVGSRMMAGRLADDDLGAVRGELHRQPRAGLHPARPRPRARRSTSRAPRGCSRRRISPTCPRWTS